MSETIGAALRAAREQRQLTLAQVSESTKLRIHYLQALENDDISAMPSAAQARGFLRLYAEFLGLDLERLIPAPIAVAPEPPADAEAAPTPAADEMAKPGGETFLKGLRRRIASRFTDKSSADAGRAVGAGDQQAAPPGAPAEAAEAQAPAADKKKQSP